MILKYLTVSALVLLMGCAGNPEPAADINSADLIPVLYGTDRAQEDIRKLDKYYGTDRGYLEYGLAGVLTDGDKYRLGKITPLSRDAFLGQLDGELEPAGSSSAMVFIHGYNRSFSQVVRLVGEFATESGFEGVAVAWSWPSVRNPAGYVADQNNMRWSGPNLEEFLQTLFDHPSVEKIHLVAHSMGGWGLTWLFVDRQFVQQVDLDRIGEFVLMAPDIDKEIFRREIGPELVAAGLEISLYVSDNDRAMASSKALNGHPRAGDSNGGPVVLPGMETIDVSDSNVSILGHSYFEESESVSRDLIKLLNTGTPAAFRKDMNRVDLPYGNYWQLQGDGQE